MPDAAAATGGAGGKGGAPDPDAPPTVGSAAPDAGAGFDAGVAAGGARADGSVGGVVGATADQPTLTTGSGDVEDPNARDAGDVPSNDKSGCGCNVPGARHSQRSRSLDWTLLALLGLALSRRRRESAH
jgi:hypothetical protein